MQEQHQLLIVVDDVTLGLGLGLGFGVGLG